ncbi:helix-turn-helix transcriptional regulator [Thiomonas intermedia]|uniref:helix-turn-helix transcriptional regulator n=1 Tax=Thiomonas intermedia TaxID=926 RepID=UPI0012ABE2C4|nr:helix-turn-helix transcriptional regulator [Thiomonas intermedia]
MIPPPHVLQDLIEAIYCAALSPVAWSHVASLLREQFGSVMESFYVLDPALGTVTSLYMQGVEERWVESLPEMFFRDDNPFTAHALVLNKPGTVRTSENLSALLGKDELPFTHSAYFNEWMRPQGFRHTLGTTVSASGMRSANVSLFRATDQRAFNDPDAVALDLLARHFGFALRMHERLAEADVTAAAAIDALELLHSPLAVVDGRRCLIYASPGLETMLRMGEILFLSASRLSASMPQDDDKLARIVHDVVNAKTTAVTRCILGPEGGAALHVQAFPLVRPNFTGSPGPRHVVLLITGTEAASHHRLEELARRFGLTRSQARLASALCGGSTLREAADRCGISYGTARGYLKMIFLKTGTHRQTDLVTLLLVDARR